MSNVFSTLPITGNLISDLTTIPVIDRTADLFEVEDVSASTSNKVTINVMLGITGVPLGTSDSQSVSNKTIGITNTVTLTDDNFSVVDGADNTKIIKFQASGITTGTTRTYTLPNATGTLADLASSQTFTNKTLTSATLTTPTINNPTLNTDTVNQFTGGNGVTVSGLNIKSGALNTANSVPTAAYQDGSIAPEHLVTGTGTGWALTTWTPSFVSWAIGTGGSAGTTAKYIQIGKMVFFWINSRLGTSGQSVGTNATFSLPVTMSTSQVGITISPIGTLVSSTASTQYSGQIWSFSTTTAGLIFQGSAGTYTNTVGSSSTVPATWAAGDSFSASGMYEAA